MRRTAIAMLTVGGLGSCLALVPSCTKETRVETTATSSTTQPSPDTPSSPSLRHTPTDLPGLEHVFRVSPEVISGGVPTGELGFETLQQLGVRTVISVDAAPPEIEALRAHGIRSIHIPVEYAGISNAQRQALAVALRDADGPIYLHCHHGKHRGPTAAALGLLSAGMISPQRAREIQLIAGTSTNYPGLFACVEQAQPYAQATFAAMEAELPEIAQVGSMASAMARIDRQFARLQLVAENNWEVPAAHPDLVPVTLAGAIENDLRRLSESLRQEHDNDLTTGYAEMFLQAMLASATSAQQLESALVSRHPDRDARFAQLAASCHDCHSTSRN